jgi:hypothetical protein
MKWENNDMIMKQHDEVKGLPHDDTELFRLDPHAPEPPKVNNETVSTHRLRDINDFC